MRDDRRLALVTVVMENFDAVRAALHVSGRPPPGLIGAPVPVPEALVAEMGGRLLVVNLAAGRVVGGIALPTPSGMCWPDGGSIWVASMWHDHLMSVDPQTGAVQRTISHPSFNDLHTVVAVDGNLLVTSSGVDAVVEIDPKTGQSPWSWWAGAWPSPVSTARVPDPEADHRGRRYATLDRALHLNSAVLWGDEVLVSAFHTGEILGVSRESGRARTCRDGLDHPHALAWAGTDDSLLCCESARGQVRVLDGQDLTDKVCLSPGLRWVQSACVSGRDTLIFADNPHFGAGRRAQGPARLVEVDTGTGLSTVGLELPAGWRLFSVLALSPEQAAQMDWIDV